MTEEEWQHVLWLLGPWLVGGFMDFMLQGILFCQFVYYFTWHKDDRPRLRWLVCGLAVMTTLKSCQTFLLVWEQEIVHFTDVAGAIALAYTSWWHYGNGLMVASIGAYVQAYFCSRLYAISQSWIVIAPISVVLVFAYVASIVTTYYICMSNTPMIGHWFAAHLSSVFAGDTLLAVTTAYFLLKATPRDGFKRTTDIINAVVRLTFQTAAPAAICAMLNLVFSQVYSGENKLVSASFNMALPKFYANSMMWTLNARLSIRLGLSSGNITSSGEVTVPTRRVHRHLESSVEFMNYADDTLDLGHAAQLRENVELSRLDAIHIRTDVESVRHGDNIASKPVYDTKLDISLNRSDES